MAQLTYTSLDEVNQSHAALRAGYKSGKAKSIKYRKHQLLQLAYLLQDNKEKFNEAIKNDLGRSSLENEMLEIFVSLAEIKQSFDNVEKWAKPESAPLSLYFLTSPKIRKEAKGVVLIFVPYNYPIFLLMSPIAGAIAAGNAVCVKTSELLPATSSLLADLFPQYLDQDLYRVVTGDVPVATRLLELRWDHVLYTGSGRVGKIVAAAAAKHLTPVTLELGGKSPTIVDPKFDLKLAARRILWGRFSNAGQTCTAPEYVLVPKEGEEALIAAMKEIISEFFPEGTSKESFGRAPTDAYFARVKGLLDTTKGTIVSGGETDPSTRYIAPTIVRGVTLDDSLMTEEIFGPILPIVVVESFDEAIEIINAREHPLALYAFTSDIGLKDTIFDSTHSGACVHNDVLMHVCDGGAHTGKYSFDLFTHLRATMSVPNWMESILSARYPPFTARKVRQLEQSTMPSFPPRDSVYATKQQTFKWIIAAVTIISAAAWLILHPFTLF
ncbi:aldehyde dehydrogenase [Thelephora ganbajun]|uniref:Aldehyde dehydrogenase n=1 Tax=Thelephora ganbajun TaxID=370292 RepID=A0ACB6ZRU1_THEGA|nr:aldehyde dehydrogenase [Thelephora ganbajun]